jgi:putative FmdB family regulatory protein
MPTYEYQCHACGTCFARSLSVDEMEKAKVRCPKCDAQSVEQRIEPVFVRTARKS